MNRRSDGGRMEQTEIINIEDYENSDRFKQLKSDVWKQAVNNIPFSIHDMSANEYKYFHKFYEISKRLIAKEITQEQAAEENKANYMKFEFDQRLWERYQFAVLEWNGNIKKSDSLRVDFARSIDLKEGYLILAEIASLLTGDKTVLASARHKVEVIGCESTREKDDKKQSRD